MKKREDRQTPGNRNHDHIMVKVIQPTNQRRMLEGLENEAASSYVRDTHCNSHPSITSWSPMRFYDAQFHHIMAGYFSL